MSPIIQRSLLPRFLIRGHLNATNCVITEPLTGELMVENSQVAIKSIELQLVRVETCGEIVSLHAHTTVFHSHLLPFKLF